MNWSPLQKSQLADLIASGLAEADDSVREGWERIRISPEKWQCSPWGDAGGGFWAVAVSGDTVIWFNDVEHGFNRSRFRTRGIIDEYRCNQGDFSHILNALPEAAVAEEFAQQTPASKVPVAAGGPGRITRRQTTYWVLQPRGAGPVRVHFSGKREARFVAPDYEAVEFLEDHPVLLDYEARWSSLFVSHARLAPPDTAQRVEAFVEAATDGWRGLGDYGGASRVREVLRTGYGLIMRGPSGIVRGLAQLLGGVGVTPSVLEEPKKHGEEARPRVVLFGRSFVVADSFRFEAAPGAP